MNADEHGRAVIAATAEQVAALPSALGSESEAFQNYLISQTVNVMGPANEGGDLTDRTNCALAIMAAAAPTNELEAVLVGQMVAAHNFSMLCWRRASAQTDMRVVESNAAMANKASRTFTLQMEALSKMRRGGEQVVRHVHVNDGGQAVIAGTFNAAQGGGGVE